MKKAAITPEQIKKWKKEHGDVHVIKIGDTKGDDGKVTGEVKVGYLREPQFADLSLAQNAGSGIDFANSILQNCWLGGDEDIKMHDKYRLAACTVIDKLIDYKEASLEKL